MSRAKLHGVLSGMTTRELDEKILSYRNSTAAMAAQSAEKDKSLKMISDEADMLDTLDTQCPLSLWKAIVHVTTTRTIGNTKVDQNNLSINFANVRQKPSESLSDYKNRILNMLDSFDAVKLARPDESMIAMRFLHGLDDGRYSSLKVYLGNELANQRDLYQPTLDLAVSQAERWLVHGQRSPSAQQQPQIINAFVADKKAQKRPDNRENKPKKPDSRQTNVETCEFCNNKGHSISKCNKFSTAQKAAIEATADKQVKYGKKQFPAVAGAMLATRDSDSDCDTPFHKTSLHITSFLAGRSSGLGRYDLILDTGANGSIVHNKELLHEIEASPALTFSGLAGSLVTTQLGTIRDLCEAHFHPKSPANIISFSQLRDAGHDLAFIKSDTKDLFTVTTATFKYKFTRRSGGLYICDLTPSKDILVNTVHGNAANHTKRDISRASNARQLQERLGNPPDNKLGQALAHGNIINTNVLPADIQRAQDIYGPNTLSLQGRTVARPPEAFPAPQESTRDTTMQSLYADIFMANGASFLITVAKPLEHILASSIESRDTATLRKVLRTHLAFYSSRRIHTPILYSDNEGGIVALQTELAADGIQLINSGPGMHVHIVERAIRYIKEGVRSIHAGLPYACPRAIFKHLIPFVALRLNMFPSSLRNDRLSAFQLVYNRPADARKDCHLTFGAMYHVVCKDRHHTMAPRTFLAIGVTQIPNGTGTCSFFTIEKQSIVSANHFTEVPLTSDMIRHLNRLAADDKASTAIDAPYFLHGRAITSVSPPASVSREHSPPEAVNTEPYTADTMTELQPEPVPTANTLPTTADMPPAAPTPIGPADIAIMPTSMQPPEEPPTLAPPTDIEAISPSLTEPPLPLPPLLVELPPPPPPPAPHVYPTRDRKPPNRLSLLNIFHMTAKRALKEDPTTARPAIEAELRTLIGKGVFRPIKTSQLTPEQRASIIRSQLNVTQKYLPTTDGTGRIKDKVKARLVGGGDCQDRSKYTTSETSSPTVSTTAIFLLAQIAAAEGRDIVTIDIGSAYLNAYMPKSNPDKLVFMRINKEVTQIMIGLDKKFSDYTNSDGTLVVELDRALYGCIESALLWFRELSGFLAKIGFVSNPYDICVMNRSDSKGDSTVGIYVDDILLTCSYPSLANTFIQELEKEYKQLKVRRGLTHNYLGMVLDFSLKGVVTISQSGMIEEIVSAPGITDLTAIVGSTEDRPKTPCTEQLFRCTESSPVLDQSLAKIVHSLTARILFIANRARPDLLTFISFMTKKVLSPTHEDGRKLLRALRYLAHTSDVVLTLGYRGVPTIHVFIDASFAVHTDKKSHTGVMSSLGVGAFYTKSTSQKINTTSSCEAELVALSKGLQQSLWSRTFLIAQGILVPPLIIHQDNQSTIKLIERGRPAAEQTRHIDIGYFWATDLITRGIITIKFCPTLSMLADFFTKPLQGSLFLSLRDQVLGVKPLQQT